MSEQFPLPAEDQRLTIVSVREGSIHVSSGRVLVSKPQTLGVEIDGKVSEPPELERGQAVTLLYTHDERVLRLRGEVHERIEQGRLTIAPVGEVKEGDRRDFRRADLRVRLRVEPLDESDPARAREAQLAREVPDEELVEQQVNLSGSGMQIESEADWAKGTLLDIRLVLPLPTPTPISAIGEVVRAAPGEERVAIRFAEVGEAEQDLVVYAVFSRYFQDAGLTDELALEV